MKLIFKTRFGSHLYGTDTPSSDEDFKGIYVCSLEDIILKKDTTTKHEGIKLSTTQRNQQGDIDCEMIELRRFIKDAMNGQTYALDMLFSTKNMWVSSSSEWEYIVQNREKLLSRNVAPYIGYCRQQAGKYGLKGSRLGELIRIIDHLHTFNHKQKLKECLHGFVGSEFIYRETKKHIHANSTKVVYEDFLCVLGKYFPLERHIQEVLDALEIMNQEYGERARLAQENKGIDWKAISHAYRCCFQLIELADQHRITFPSSKALELKKIKAGEISYNVIQEELPNLMQLAVESIERSTLPDQPDNDFWEQFILSTYIK